MSPRIANKDRGELPKPQVQPGSVGFSPINPLTLSYAYHDIGDRILYIPDETDASLSGLGTTKQVMQVRAPGSKADQKPDVFEFQGKLLRGLSDGLYRGKLPEVIVSSPSFTQFGPWLNEISEYLEKMLQFGFFLQEDPVARLFPNMVIVSEGIYFKRLMLALSKQLDNIPSLTPQWRQLILAKCHRGMLLSGSGQPANAMGDHASEPIQLQFPPMHIRIAANHPLLSFYVSPFYGDIESILTLQGFQVSLENSVPNAVERLELEYALARSSSLLTSGLPHDGEASKESVPLQKQVWNAIVRVGKLLQAFDSEPSLAPPEPISEKSKAEKTGKTTVRGKSKNGADVPTPAVITPSDVTIFDSLRHYAETFSLPEEQALFAAVNRSLEQEWRNRNNPL